MDQITEIQARFAIEELFAQYAHTIDSYDGPGWVNCFTTDGVFEVAGEGDDSVRFTGHEQLSVFAHAHIRLLPGTRHVMTNHVTEFEGETKLLGKALWDGVVDTVGGNILAHAISQTKHSGIVAACGNASGNKLNTSVIFLQSSSEI